MSTRIAYSLKEAAEQVQQSVDTLRKAIRTTELGAFPPPLKAKRDGKKYLVLHAELVRWAESLPDA